MKHYLSLGAGVQSTTLALMFAHGEMPVRLDAAIFADTQCEPVSVYRHLNPDIILAVPKSKPGAYHDAQ